jgi:hypothetical protein
MSYFCQLPFCAIACSARRFFEGIAREREVAGAGTSEGDTMPATQETEVALLKDLEIVKGDRCDVVHLRPSGYGGHPSRGLPSAAHAGNGKRERRMVGAGGIEPPTPRV